MDSERLIATVAGEGESSFRLFALLRQARSASDGLSDPDPVAGAPGLSGRFAGCNRLPPPLQTIAGGIPAESERARFATNMALVSRIYFNAVFGALGGLLGWMLFGVFGDKNAADSAVTHQLLMGGALIGGAIGYFIVSVEAIRDRSLIRFVRLASYGVVLGLLGGALGILIGDWVNYLLIKWLGASRENTFLHLLGTMFARGLGWMFLGVAVGFSEG